jgi:triosephosphate isomerase (TIM)
MKSKRKKLIKREVKKQSKKSWLIVGNWKMNPKTADEAKSLIRSVTTTSRKLKNTVAVLCPPFPYIPFVKIEKKVLAGAQDNFFEEQGQFTGNVSPHMLKSLGCAYVIVGHSERRKLGETNEIVAKKVRSATRAGLKVILCIGEDHRDTEGNYLASIREQLKESLVYTERSMLLNVVIAYEPVWAIGGRSAVASHDIHQAVIFIRKVLTEMYAPEIIKSISILYGGSSNATNTEDVLSHGEVEGLLVGGASLIAKEFGTMLTIADSIKK